MAKIDLHIHSIYSDGDLSPKAIYTLCKERKISTFSLTDHDEIKGLREMVELTSNDPDICFIPGIEMTAKVSHGRMHILGYNIDVNNELINRSVKEKKDSDFYNLMLQYELIKERYGIVFTDEEIEKIRLKNGNVSRNDLFHLFVKYGYADNVKGETKQDYIFRKYLNPVFEEVRKEKKGISKEQCFKLIKDANGYVFFAHPNSYAKTYEDLKQELIYMKSIGLDGVEVYHPNIPDYYRKWLLDLANELDLMISGGTDYHGSTVKPDIQIGTGRCGNVDIDELELVDKIKTYRR